MDTEIRQLEEALRIAMLSSDVAALDALIADALIFALGRGLWQAGRSVAASFRSTEIEHGRVAIGGNRPA